jgi:predicted ATPase/signal transduction histidine kinase
MTILSQYKILETLCRFGKTVICRAYRESDSQLVLLKIFEVDYPTPDDIARLQHEYKITGSLKFTGILKPIELQISDRDSVIVYEYFPGKPLQQYLEKCCFAIEDFLAIAIQITEILQKIHDKNLIHNCLTPRSIWWDVETKQVIITNFCLSSSISEEKRNFSINELFEGDLMYISPEQTGRINRVVDYRTDFYSLGAIFYEMLATPLFQTKDLIQLIHFHLAKQPLPLQQVNGQIPLVISEIIDRLLSKAAEHRYQSGYGIKFDLERCLQQWQASGEIKSFSLATQDLSKKLCISQKLYGREREITVLLEAFERVKQGESQLILVSGFAGVGKTTLIREVYQPIVQSNGYFISGKFSQIKQDIAYSFLMQAFRNLILQVLTESDEKIQIWKKKLLAALENNGQVIIETIPELELIIGKQPTLIRASVKETKNRFETVLQNFLAVFCQKEHPLVLFLDDLQWSDFASLKLIYFLISQASIPYLLIIGTYRDNEVDRTHPLAIILKNLELIGRKTKNLNLEPLEINSITQLLSDSFNCSKNHTSALAKLILNKTHGNPFFINQLLKTLSTEKLLEFDFQQKAWQWDLKKIENAQIADNVVDFTIAKIQKLSKTNRELLQVAACMGNHFDVRLLASVIDKPVREIIKGLEEALDKSLIITSKSYYLIADDFERDRLSKISQNEISYRFIHDRVHQAAYSLLSTQKCKQIHLKIGKIRLTQTSLNLEEEIFEIVNHLNAGSDLILKQDEKLQLFQLNLQAGRKAKSTTAYESAILYFYRAIDWLDEHSWKQDYSSTFSLYLEVSELEYLTGKFEQAEQRFQILLEKTKTKSDRASVEILKITLYANLGKMQEAIAVGINSLNLFKIKINLERLKQGIDRELKIIKEKLSKYTIDDLYHLPQMSDRNSLVVMKILISLAAPAYLNNLDLWTLIMLKMINISLQYGNTKESAFAYSAYGLLIGSAFNDYETGYQFGQLAFKVNEKFQDLSLSGKIYFMFGAFINHWKQHVKEDLYFLKKSFEYSNQIGDRNFSAYAANVIAAEIYYKGDPLTQIDSQIKVFVRLAEKSFNNHGIYFQRLVRQIVLALQGLTYYPISLDNDTFDEQIYLKKLQNFGFNFHLGFYYIAKIKLYYFFSNYKTVLNMVEKSKVYLDCAFGLLQVVEHHFYYALTLSALYLQATSEVQTNYWQTLLEIQNKFKLWSEKCPENFLHQYWLISAELARISEQFLEAMELYDRAIASAKENEYYQNESLANELAAKFYLNKNKPKIAKLYIKEAYYGYLRWGAVTKVKDLEQKYPELLSTNTLLSKVQSNGMTDLELDNKNASSSLDLATIIKSYQAISSEIALGKLLETLIKIAIENAGAQQGFFLLERENQWFIEVQGKLDEKEEIVLHSLPIETISSTTKTTLLSLAIVNYVIRTQQNIVLNNASIEKQFLADPYISANQPKSILCIPLIDRTKTNGILYLENNLTSNAFSSDRVELLKILLSQAAISLENSRLYEKLEEYNQTLKVKVEERTKELQQKNEELAKTLQTLRKTQAQIIAQEKLASLGTLTAGIAHEIKNPLNFVNNFAELSIELAQELHQEINKQKDKLALESQSYIEELINDICQNAQKIEEHGKRADKIVRGMLMHSRGESGTRQLTDINAVLAESLNLAYHGMRAKEASFQVAIETHYDKSIEPISIFPQDISRAFLNIINNACYAVHQKKNSEPDFSPILIVTTHNLDESIMIRIRDNGNGIPFETIAKIFTPFFTTKPTGEGTGLGLSISHDIIVQTHQGEIRLETETNRYTEFIIVLPKTVT